MYYLNYCDGDNVLLYFELNLAAPLIYSGVFQPSFEWSRCSGSYVYMYPVLLCPASFSTGSKTGHRRSLQQSAGVSDAYWFRFESWSNMYMLASNIYCTYRRVFLELKRNGSLGGHTGDWATITCLVEWIIIFPLLWSETEHQIT
jgi:hypothetical protein